MSQLNEQQQIQNLIFSINPLTANPYPANSIQVADGQGTRIWQDVFQTISSQSQGGIVYLPSTLSYLTDSASSVSTIVATSYSTLSTQIGNGGIPGSITGNQLESTVRWVQNDSKYISTADLTSSMTPFLNGSLSFMSNIQSTVVGLGSSRYISSPTLLSSIQGVGLQQASTVVGLGSSGYVSTLSLLSSIQGIGLQQTSTVVGLGSSGYVSTLSLPSTVNGLGTLGYVSTQTLLSTSAGIQTAKQNIFIDRSGATNIYGSQVFISSVEAITFLSSFVNSTVTYKGGNGLVTGTVTNNSNLYFSTASLQFDRFSSFITPQSRVTIDLYPTYQFDTLTTGSLTSKALPMSTFIQYGSNYLSTTHQTQVAGISAQNGYSNFYQQPIRMSIPGSQLQDYTNPYILTHMMPGAISYQINVGFRGPAVNTFFASTNSYFLTVQNLSF